MGLLEDFFEKNVEGFLFNDLNTIARTDASYPTILTCFAGIELLGAIVYRVPFNKDDGRLYFREYWTRYLYPTLPNCREIAEDVYKFVRNGIAHVYVMKGHFGAGTTAAVPHLSQTSDGVIYIDAGQLVRDLRASYETLLKQVASDHALAANMLAQVTAMRDQYATDAKGIRTGNFAPAGVAADKKAISQSFAP